MLWSACRDLDSGAARRRILELEQDHGERRSWVWASMGCASLAQAIEHLAKMANVTERIGVGYVGIGDHVQLRRGRMGCRPSGPRFA